MDGSSENGTGSASQLHRLTFRQITAADYKIRSGLVETTCNNSRMSEQLGMHVWLKKDFMQYTGSFKERGVRNALLHLDEDKKKRGVVAVSAGSYAFAMAYHAHLLAIPATIFMPTYAPMMHIKNCAKYNCTAFLQGDDIDQATDAAKQYALENDCAFINLRTDPDVVAGNGTVGLDIVRQVPQVDVVVVPVGDGTLPAAVALAVKGCLPNAKVVACFCPSINKVATLEPPLASNDSVENGVLVTRANLHYTPLIDKIVSVSEHEVAGAIVKLVELEKSLVEEDGACGFAALCSGKLDEFKDKNVAVVLSEGNMDTTSVERVIDRGLVASGRLHEISLTISDLPGGLKELTGILGAADANIIQIYHDRRFGHADIFTVQVRCTVETYDEEHATKLKNILIARYCNVKFDAEITQDDNLEDPYDFS